MILNVILALLNMSVLVLPENVVLILHEEKKEKKEEALAPICLSIIHWLDLITDQFLQLLWLHFHQLGGSHCDFILPRNILHHVAYNKLYSFTNGNKRNTITSRGSSLGEVM